MIYRLPPVCFVGLCIHKWYASVLTNLSTQITVNQCGDRCKYTIGGDIIIEVLPRICSSIYKCNILIHIYIPKDLMICIEICKNICRWCCVGSVKVSHIYMSWIEFGIHSSYIVITQIHSKATIHVLFKMFLKLSDYKRYNRATCFNVCLSKCTVFPISDNVTMISCIVINKIVGQIWC